MNKQYKKIFSVLSAILVGAVIISFALKGDRINKTEDSAPTKNSDWKDSLSVVPQTDFLKTLSASIGSAHVNTATSTADIVARELLINYTITQEANMSTTTLSDADARAIAQVAASKIELPKARQYTEKNLRLLTDNGPEATAAYIMEIDDLLRAFNLSQINNDISVVFATPKSVIDIKRNSRISENIAHYEKLINELLKMSVPSSLATPHIHLVQKYSNIQATIKPMSEIFTDPLKGLSALTRYRSEIAGFDLIAKEYELSLLKNLK